MSGLIGKAIKTFDQESLAAARLQDESKRRLESIGKIDFLNGNLLENQTIGTSTQLEHKLGRTPRGFLVLDIQGAATIYRNSWTENFITLTASSSVVCNIWIF